MAVARIVYEGDGFEVEFEVSCEDSFPDAIAQCASEVKRMYRDVMADPKEA